MGFVDLHSHILPDLDDGAKDSDASMTMIGGLCELGFETICATPHQKAGWWMPSSERIEAAHQLVRSAVAGAGLEVEIRVGAENMWDDVFFERLQSDGIPGYSGSPAFLVEFPVHQLPIGFLDHLFRLRIHGTLPVIAHPERYQPLWETRDRLEQLAGQCAMVVDLGAVAGDHGRSQAKIARAMLERGLAHAAASDAHEPSDLKSVRKGMAWIRKKLGESALQRLLDEAPRRILAGVHPQT